MIRRVRAWVPSATGAAVATSLALQMLLVVSGVVVARALGVENRGYLALFLLVSAALAQFGSLGLPLAVTYEVARRPSSASRVARAVAGPAIAQVVVLGVAQALIVFALTHDEVNRVRIAGLLSAGAIPALLVQQYALALLQGQQRFTAFNYLRVAPHAAYTCAVGILVAASATTLTGVVLAWVIAGTAVSFVTLGFSLVGLKARDPRGVVEIERAGMIRFGLRAILGSASPIETFRIDQAVVGLVLSPLALGLYAAAVSFTHFPRFIAQSVGLVAYPRVAGAQDAAEQESLQRKFFAVTCAFIVATVVGLELSAGRIVPFFFGRDFESATPLLQILLIGTAFISVRRILSDLARGRGHPAWGSAAEIVSWVVFVPALLGMAHLWGAEGVAGALTLAAFASVVAIALPMALHSRRTEGFSRPLTDLQKLSPEVIR